MPAHTTDIHVLGNEGANYRGPSGKVKPSPDKVLIILD
jgi:hypothetical protein